MQLLYTSEWILLCIYFHLPSGISAHKWTQVKWDFKIWWLSAWLQSLFPIIMIIILSLYFKKIGIRVLNITFFLDWQQNVGI